MSGIKEFFGWVYSAIFGRWANLASPLPIDRAERALEIAVQSDDLEVQVDQVEIKIAA